MLPLEFRGAAQVSAKTLARFLLFKVINLTALVSNGKDADECSSVRLLVWRAGVARPDAVAISAWTLAAPPQAEALWRLARFASLWQLRCDGFLGDQGIILGKHRGCYVSLPHSLNAINFGRQGTGKTSALMIPNLLMHS